MSAAPAPTRMGWLRGWWQADRGSLIQFFALVLTVLSFLWLWPSLIEAGGARLVLTNIFVHWYALVVLLVLSVSVRSIGFREVLSAYLIGTFLVPTLVFAAGWPVLSSLGSNSSTIAIFWAAPLEETALLLAVALMAWRLSRRPGRKPALIDLMIVGYALGSGFAVHEDALYGRLFASFPATTLQGAFEGPYGWLFPSFSSFPSSSSINYSFFTYHGGSGAVLGVVVGVIVLFRRRLPWIVWALPATWFYLVLEHGLVNFQVNRGPTWARYLIGNGHVVGIAIVLAVPTLIFVAHRRRQKATLDPPAFGLRSFRDIATFSDGPVDTLVRWLALARYHRTRNAALVAAWREPQGPPPDVRDVDAWGHIALGRGLFDAPPELPLRED